MDVNGAKALKKRLAQSGAEEAPATPRGVDIAEDAPPVYHWVGVARKASRDGDDEGSTTSPSLFSRLGLSFR
jgi:hypothetical protein